MIRSDGRVSKLEQLVPALLPAAASINLVALPALALLLLASPAFAQTAGAPTNTPKPPPAVRRAAVAAATVSGALPDGFRLPFAGNATWTTTSQEHTGSSAQAIDFIPAAGPDAWNQDVLAADDGEVIYQDEQKNKAPLETFCAVNPSMTKGFGNLIILYHPRTGHQTYYAHLAAFATGGVGAKVSKGQVIGVMGDTGCSSAPHLHFELRNGGGSTAFLGTSASLVRSPGINSDGTAHAPRPAVAVLLANGADSCKANSLDSNDDGSTGPVALPFPLNFFGATYTSAYVNNNGNITFTGPSGRTPRSRS
jgi:murein DD-endopeptidase MepM/ murein hydrolase activator NlpD